MIYFELGMTEDGKPQVLNAGASDLVQVLCFASKFLVFRHRLLVRLVARTSHEQK